MVAAGQCREKTVVLYGFGHYIGLPFVSCTDAVVPINERKVKSLKEFVATLYC